MASTQDYLNLISQYESGSQNVVNYLFGPGRTAQGYYQITNTNWSNYAPLVGVDLSVYPTAMSAPQNVQAQVAGYLLTQTPAGISNWSNFNPQLAAALSAAGMQTSGAVSDYGITSVPSGGEDTPIIDLSGAAATTPTADILSQIDTSIAGVVPGLDPNITLAVLALAGLAAAVAIAR